MEEATINETAAPVEPVTAPEQTAEQTTEPVPEMTAEEMQIIWQNAWKQAAEILAAAGNKQR